MAPFSNSDVIARILAVGAIRAATDLRSECNVSLELGSNINNNRGEQISDYHESTWYNQEAENEHE